MPFPHTAKNGPGILVVPRPEAAFFTPTHVLVSSSVLISAKGDTKDFYVVWVIFARISLRNNMKIGAHTTLTSTAKYIVHPIDPFLLEFQHTKQRDLGYGKVGNLAESLIDERRKLLWQTVVR